MPASWWTSLDRLTTLNAALQIALAVAAFATGALTLAVWKVSAQISYLQDKQQLEFQTQSEQKIATANEHISKANQVAATANESAERARADSAGANARAEQAIAETATARLEQEKIRKHNLELSLKYEEERIARLKIEERIAWRHVTDQQRADFLRVIRPVTGMRLPHIQLLASGNDPETHQFSGDVAELLREAGYVVEYSPGDINIGLGDEPGVRLAVSQERIHEAQALATALVQAGIAKKPMPVLVGPTPVGMLNLIVGPRGE